MCINYLSWLLLVTILSIFITSSQSINLSDGPVYNCTNTKVWQCIVQRLDSPLDFENMPHLVGTGIKPTHRKSQANIYFSYLNKVNRDSGLIYVSARLKIELQQSVMENATGMWIQIIGKNPELKPIFYRAYITQNQSIPSGYTIDFTIPIENQLKHDEDYSLKFDLLPLQHGISLQKNLSIPSYVLPQTNCDKDMEPDYKRQSITSRFTGSFRQLTFYPHHSTVNLSFYAAPRSYCLSYEVQLEEGGVLLVQRHVIPTSEMVEINGTALIGTVTLSNIQADKDYSVRIIPYSETKSCACFDCSCMMIMSQLFTLSKIKTIDNANIDQLKHTSAEQLLKIKVVDDRSSNGIGSMFLLIVFFCLLSLTLITSALIILLCRNINRPTALILVKPIGEQQKLLLSISSQFESPCESQQTLLILNAEPLKSKLVDLLAKMLNQSGNNLYVIQMERELDAIEKNLQSWCHETLIKANKILLFHSNRAAYIFSTKTTQINNQHSIFDSAFQTLLSLVHINDNRFIHAYWDNQKVTLFHNVETIYSIPRDIQYLFNSVSNSLPTIDQCSLFQKEYEKTIKAIEDGPSVIQPILIELPMINAIVTKEVVNECQQIQEHNIPYSEDDNRYSDSGFITMDTVGKIEENRDIAEESVGNVRDVIKGKHVEDVISITNSEDSGLIL